ncbi:MAG: hypothetical protein ACI9OU_000210 [Candidatus Promineifilaceae bacterium]|jgi:hypothetical protein
MNIKTIKTNVPLAMCLSAIVFGTSAQAFEQTADSWTAAHVSVNASANSLGGTMTVGFTGLTDLPGAGLVGATVLAGSSSATFAGDYNVINAQSISFNLNADVSLSEFSRVIIKIGNGEIWEHNGLINGENSVGLSSGDGWTSTYLSPLSDFSAHLGDVIAIGLILQPDMSTGLDQTVVISNFRLTADAPVGSTALETALMARFGVMTAGDVTGTNLVADIDDDGLSDLNEILAELDPEFIKDNLIVELFGYDTGGADLRWVHIKGKFYTILRSDSVDGVYSVVDIVEAPDTGKNLWTYTDDDLISSPSSKPVFYKVCQN